jgi:hypothetical protein
LAGQIVHFKYLKKKKKKTSSQKWAGGVVQGIGLEFKAQHHKNKK